MNRKQLYILAAGLLLAVAVAALIIFGRTLFVGATEFGFGDANRVRRITITSSSGQLKLRKRGRAWVVNGEQAAQAEKVNDALFALQMLQVKYPLPASHAAAYEQAMQRSALHLRLSGRLGGIRRYTVCQLDTLLVGTLREGQPYVLEVRGNEGLDLLSMLSANPLFWRKTLLVSIMPSHIAAVAVEDLGKPERSFKLSIDTLGQAQVEALYSGEVFRNLNEERLQRYLSYYQSVSFERYVTDPTGEDVSDIALSPAYIFTIENVNGHAQTFTLLHMPVRDTLDAFGRPAEVDLNRCYLQQEGDPKLAIALWVDFDILIKDISYFLTK
jgi:hypothetical protein